VSSNLHKIESALNSINQIEKYTTGLTVDEFLENDLAADATLIHFINLGERLNSVSTSFKQAYPDLPYKFSKETRNVIAHQYDIISRIAIWDTIINQIPKLKAMLQTIIESLNAE